MSDSMQKLLVRVQVLLSLQYAQGPFSNWRTTMAARQLDLEVYLLSNM